MNNLTRTTAWALFGVMISFIVTNRFSLPEVISWLIESIILMIFFYYLKQSFKIANIDKIGFYYTLIFIIWMIFNFIRGMFHAEGYWVWKYMVFQLLISLFYFAILISTNTKLIQKYYRLYFLAFLPVTLISIALGGNLSMNFVPYTTLLLFIGIIPKRKRWLLIVILILYIITVTHRNDFIKMVMPLIIGIIISYFYNYYTRIIIKYLRIVLFIFPFIFFGLAATGVFNIFNFDKYIKNDYYVEVTFSSGKENRNLKDDTRSHLYENVLYTLTKYDDLIWGRSTAYGDEGVNGFWDKEEGTGYKGRYGNEVGILDILLWYGIIGVILYLLIYLRASYLAIFRSNNRFAKGVGLYVSYLWVAAFIWEKPLFETFFMMDLIMLGLCFSKPFRYMTDREMIIWVNGIFNKRISKITS